MESLKEDVVKEIIDYIESSEIGASASEISKGINKNRITVSKYLEVLKSRGVLKNKQLAQAKYWETINDRKKPRVLIVDDDNHIRELVKLSLVHKDFDLAEAHDGVEALEKIRKNVPDLLILDLMMPRLDGFEVCQMLRQNPKTENLPIIMLTAKTQILDKVQGLKKGADDYITKPFNPLELEARIDAVLSRHDNSIKLNSVTGLPAYDALIDKLRDTKAKIIFFDIVNFRDYNKKFGFQKGNDLLKLVSRIVRRRVHEFGTSEDFVSHIGSDDFVVLTYADSDRLVEELKKSIENQINSIVGEKLDFTFAVADSLDVNQEIESQDMNEILKKAKVV
jgi:diguanylate cyclase (GGDEF)-like protein